MESDTTRVPGPDGETNPPTRATARDVPLVPPEVAAADASMQFGKFVRTKRLGAGGMGEVWKAWDTELARWVALKFIKGGSSGAPSTEGDQDLERFKREARTAAKLSHPNVASIFEVGELGGVHYIAMQFVDGSTLKKFRIGAGAGAGTSTRVAKREAQRLVVRMVRDAARGVQAAHEGAVIHRDIKPENVMVTGDAERHVYVMDFGLARSAEGASGLTMSGMIVGTPNYMPPEQARGQPVDCRADVYALGATLYEMLTGVPPCVGANVYETLMLVTDREPATPRGLDPAIDADLETVILKCLEKDRTRRYGSAADLAHELTRWLAGEAILAHPPSALYKFRKRIGRNPWAWAGLMVALVAVSAGGAGIAMITSRSGYQRAAAERLQRAERLYDAGELGEVRALVEEALALQPESAEGRTWRVRLAIRDYQVERGVPQVWHVRGIMELMPMAPESASQKARREAIEGELRSLGGRALAEGILAMWSGHPDAAIDAFQKVPKDAPGAWEAELYRGLALYLRGDFEAAREPLTKHRARDPQLAQAVYVRTLLAIAQEWAHAGRDALVPLQQAIGASHEVAGPLAKQLEAQCHVIYGWAEYQRGDDPRSTLRRALAMLGDDDSLESHLTRGDAFLTLAKALKSRGALDPREPAEFISAAAEFEKAAASHPAAWLRCAEVHHVWHDHVASFGERSMRLLEMAREDYRRAAQFLPRDPDGAVGLAIVAWRLAEAEAKEPQERRRAAEQQVRAIEATLKASRGPVSLHVYLAQARYELGVATELCGDSADALYDAAIQAYDEILATTPRTLDARRRRGRALLNRAAREENHGGDATPAIAAALADFEYAVKSGPGDAENQVALAQCRQQIASLMILKGVDPLPELERALAAVRLAIATNPVNAEAHCLHALIVTTIGEARSAGGMDASAEFEAANAAYRKALSVNANDATTLAEFSRARRTQGLIAEHAGGDPAAAYAEALKHADRALALNATLLEGWLARAAARAALGTWKSLRGERGEADLEAALQDYGHAIDLHPTNWRAWHHRGLLRQNIAMIRHVTDEEYAELLKDLDRAVELNATAGESWRDRGLARLNAAQRRGDDRTMTASALQDFDRAIRLNRLDAEAWRYRGSAHSAMAGTNEGEERDPAADYRAALGDLAHSLTLNGRDAETYRTRAQVLQNQAAWKFRKGVDASSDYEAALKDYQAAIELNPLDPEVYSGRGITWTNIGFARAEQKGDPTREYEAAIADHAKALSLNPANAGYATDLGVVCRMLGLWRSKHGKEPTSSYEAALEAFTKAATIDPEVGSIHLECAKTLLLLGGVDSARREEMKKRAAAELRRAANLDPSLSKEVELYLKAAVRKE